MESSVKYRSDFECVYYDAIGSTIIPRVNWIYNYYWIIE